MMAYYACFARRDKQNFVLSEKAFWAKGMATVHGVVFSFQFWTCACTALLMQKGPP
jgi:hypothetical protein